MKYTVKIETEEAEIIDFRESKTYPVLHNFLNSQVIGNGKVTFEEGSLWCEIDLIGNLTASGLYPAVGYQVLEKDLDGNVKRAKLFAVGLCNYPNLDKSIEQIK